MPGTKGPSHQKLSGVDGLRVHSRRENLRRNSFLVGLVILLALIAGSGALSFYQIENFEREVSARGRMNARHLRVALALQQQIARLSAESRTYVTTLSVGASAFPSRNRMRSLERDVASRITQESSSVLGQTPEWAEFEQAYKAFAADLESRQSLTPEGDALLLRLETATGVLIGRIEANSAQLDDDADRMSAKAKRDVLLTTGICFTAGLAISILAFTETRRRIALVENALVELVQWRRFTESVLDGMDSAILTVDPSGNVTSANVTSQYILGLGDAPEVIGLPIGDVLRDHPPLVALLDTIGHDTVSTRRYLGRVELGRESWLFQVGVSPLRAVDGTEGYILTLADVTESERANEELRRNRALTAVGQMTAQVAHEIKNPLGGVRLAAQVLERRIKDDPEAMDLVRRIQNSIDHLARTVTELNQFARPSELRLAPTHLPSLLDELIAMVGDKVDTKRVVVERSYDAMPEGEWDEGELRKAFINFLVNALEASPDNARLFVTAEYRSGELEAAVVTIRDEGAGMSEETLRRLFEPFYTTKSQGTGLGMSIARKIIEIHRGQLDVRSTQGEGTTVVVTLPLTRVGAGLTSTSERI